MRFVFLGVPGLVIALVAALIFFWKLQASSYSVSARNISPNGEYGVILIDFPARLSHEQKDEGQRANEVYLYPWVDRRLFGSFDSSNSDLPDSITVKWQLARLSDCESVNDYDSPPERLRKRFCTWHPVEGMFFTKTIDLTPQKNSEAFQSKGEFINIGSPRFKTARLTITFTDDQVEVGDEAGVTNPWR